MAERTNLLDCRFEELSHTAEVGLRIWAQTRRALCLRRARYVHSDRC